mmetsp:Transcript_30030/g.72527  ORF Transcript_30030/g.72527 Transcript_30030/m.72527 type:complete len:107 (-) Transcript_30030:1125-1445(-)
MVGAEVGPPVGSIDPAGVGANEGTSEGLISLDGIEEALGDPDGWVEIEGCIDGISDGDSLCAMARKTTKSDAVAAAAFETASTFSWVTVLDITALSKLSTAMPCTS